MASEDAPAAEPAAASSQTLSQLVARVLGQLSLSAWLPSAALVLLLDFVAELGAQLDSGHPGPVAALGSTFAKMADIGIGSAVLLVIAIVVLTMLTQAFSFQAIQLLEGYWGTSGPADWVGRRRCDRHRRARTRLTGRRARLTRAAWTQTQQQLTDDQEQRRISGEPVLLTPKMLSALKARVLEEDDPVGLSPRKERVVAALLDDWESQAPAEPLRRRANVDKRLADYPADTRMLPTRLGNILRAHEDQVRRTRIRSFVQEIFDDLPPALQAEHDEQRTRLDLYCSMVIVLAVAGLIAVARLAAHHWTYAVFSVAVTLTGMRIMYGAGLATARAYGNILLTIRDRATASASSPPSLASASPPARAP
jgi:hypothetical protein